MQRWLSIRHWGAARFFCIGFLLPSYPPQSGVFRAIPGEMGVFEGEWQASLHTGLAFPKVEEYAVTALSGIWQNWWQAACCVTQRWEAEMSKQTLWTKMPQHKSSSSKSLNFPPRETAWLVMTLIYCQIYFSFWKKILSKWLMLVCLWLDWYRHYILPGQSWRIK